MSTYATFAAAIALLAASMTATTAANAETISGDLCVNADSVHHLEGGAIPLPGKDVVVAIDLVPGEPVSITFSAPTGPDPILAVCPTTSPAVGCIAIQDAVHDTGAETITNLAGNGHYFIIAESGFCGPFQLTIDRQ
ncbi:hypothetical protein [Tahibacter amnicola]|uniref:Uncharacterized protein n=1 Tax=Tahibacter amnicola TaxID=2976241 RepID=A0ABY6BG38_9GAMM|nr:hypothetical protein [Tahibacter amnicola]UXI67571.1 hypothetical protein N4264_22990 [Tahibacter amnicola]